MTALHEGLSLLGRANRLILARKKLAAVVVALCIGPGLLVAAGLQVLSGVKLSRPYGITYFAASGNADPVWLQHFVLFAAHPETISLILGIGLFLTGAWANAIWWRSQNAPLSLRVPLGGLAVVMALMWGPEAAAGLASYATYVALGQAEIAGAVLGLVYGVLSVAVTLSLSCALVSAAQALGGGTFSGAMLSGSGAFEAARGRVAVILAAALLLILLHSVANEAGYLMKDLWREAVYRGLPPAGWTIIALPVLLTLPTALGSLVSGWLFVLQAAVVWLLATGHNQP